MSPSKEAVKIRGTAFDFETLKELLKRPEQPDMFNAQRIDVYDGFDGALWFPGARIAVAGQETEKLFPPEIPRQHCGKLVKAPKEEADEHDEHRVG